MLHFVAQVKFSRRTSVSWRMQVQLLPFGMYTEEVQDTLQETNVPRLNFTWAHFVTDSIVIARNSNKYISHRSVASVVSDTVTR